MKKIFTFSLFLCLFSLSLYAQGKSYESVINELDNVIYNKGKYLQNREVRISSIKDRIKNSYNKSDRYALYDSLYTEYLHYQTDSALSCVRIMRKLIPAANSAAHENELKIMTSEVYSLMGMYNEAYELLCSIDKSTLDRSLLNYYYRTFRAYYGWIADYTTGTEEKKRYLL